MSEGGGTQLPDLVLVLLWKDETGELLHCYLDCLPLVDQSESKDWNYVASTFDELEASGFFAPFTKIVWWSDIGPAHFRTSNTLYYFRTFQDRTGIEVRIFFFAPYHGLACVMATLVLSVVLLHVRVAGFMESYRVEPRLGEGTNLVLEYDRGG